MRQALVILILICCGCSTLKKSDSESYTIIGRWCSKSIFANYPHLTFNQDGYVIFDCKIDTVFGMKYTLEDSYLLLQSINQPTTTKREKILKLTKDSLVLETLLELKTKQVYYRCK